MRRALIRDGHACAFAHFALGLALHQRANTAIEPVNLLALRAHDIGQIFDHAGEMRDLFFKWGRCLGHSAI